MSVETWWLRLAFAAAAALAAPRPAMAATITPGIENGSAIITIRGEAVPGDAAKFAAIVAAAPPDPKTIVDLAGPGGMVGDGLRIGLVIHKLGWTTRVGDGKACYSTCAFTWIAGTRRLMSADAHVAFHAPFNKKTFEVTDNLRHVMEIYAKATGLNDATVAFIMAKKPGEGFDWLDGPKAKALGLDVEVVTSKTRHPGHFSTTTVDAVEGEQRDERNGGGNAVMKDIVACYAVYRRRRTEDAGLKCFALESAGLAMAHQRASAKHARLDPRFTMPAAGRRLAIALMATGHNKRTAKALILRWMADLSATAAR